MSNHPPFKRASQPDEKLSPSAEVEAERPDFPVNEPQFTMYKTPAPDWKPGQGLNGTSSLSQAHRADQPRIAIDPTETPGLPYKLMIAAIAPRPIAFVSTISKEGVVNVAPFSFFQAVSGDPPTIVFTASTRNTSSIIKESGEFVVNIISEPMVEGANYTAIDSPEDVSEFDLSGFTTAPSTIVKPPRVAESPFSMECTLVHSYDLTSDISGKNTGTVFIGKIKMFHVLEAAYDKERGYLDPGLLAQISRLGGIRYGRSTQAYELPRPVWAVEKEKDEVKEVLGRK